ncbi:5-formyltetrahydrofolate cyclo-ligase [Pedobacter sp. MW01-1-1]|uniref:5-formyltetrahydrofolate cyclo-ligase n=1 Tax=Pedobacter sp. MW01-1-1 TaxID=3383027 RepID=UPI003FEEADB1
MLKNQIRKEALKNRLLMPEEEYDARCHALLKQFSLLDFSAIQVLHIFIPITEKREPNTFLIIDWLQQYHPHIQIIIPKADFKTCMLSNHLYEDRAALQKNAYNILEPLTNVMYSGPIDMVLIPLLAFDKRGYRVGYGKGFYDRFLKNIKTQKIGVSLFDVMDCIDDVHVDDIRLDACITPTEILFF